jgi:hypothetical protein
MLQQASNAATSYTTPLWAAAAAAVLTWLRMLQQASNAGDSYAGCSTWSKCCWWLRPMSEAALACWWTWLCMLQQAHEHSAVQRALPAMTAIISRGLAG